jgi:outer membrane receptor protein involved in Fe transport
MNTRPVIACLLAGASLIAATPAMAQATAATAPQSASADEAAAEADRDAIVVTGSRVIRNGDASPTPVTVAQFTDLQATIPTTIADGLNSLPVFSGSRNQFGNPNPQGGNGAANQLNLRNLGANRNLILFDGHRVPPTLTDGTVDVDMIPQQLIQRVDIVTGGVGAVYGSDAISGVVNFIIDHRFNGFKVHAQHGISQYGDGSAYNASATWGTNLFDGRGHFEASYEYRKDEGVLSRASREWNQQWAATGLGTTNFPYYLAPNVRLANTSFGGLVNQGIFSGQNFKTDGVLSPFVAGQLTGSAGVQIGGDGAYYDDSLKAPLRSHQIFARFDYDVSDSIHFYAMGSANLKQNAQYLSPPILANIVLSATNPFLAQTYQTQLATARQTTLRLSKFLEQAPRRTPTTESDQYFFNAGLDGKLGKYDWSVSYVRGQTKQVTTQVNNTNLQNLYAAIDAVKDTNGNIVCNVTLTNPGLYPGCVPLNLFGPTAGSQAAIDYVLFDTSFTARTQMDDIEASISGSPFDLWAGPVMVALSGEYRLQSYRQNNNEVLPATINCTGLRFNCTAGGVYANNVAQDRSRVSQRVIEGAIEVDLPLIKDVPLIRSLNVNGAARYTSYRTNGKYWTWKGGVDWHIFEDLRFRGAISRDIRAPTLSELYAPPGQGLQTSTDLLTGQTPTVPLYTGGNPNLKAEIGNTLTAGLVWKPAFFRGFSLAVDYYRIRIKDALSSQLGTVASAQNACYDSGGTSPFCQLQTRPGGFSRTPENMVASNAVTSWRTLQLNIAEAHAEGIDVEANYESTLFTRPLRLRLFATYQPTLVYDVPGLPLLNHAGVAYSTGALYPAPKLSITNTINFKPTESLTVNATTRWRSKLTMKNEASQQWVNPIVPSFWSTNLNLNWDVESGATRFSFFANIQNLFDRKPPPAAFFSAQTQPGQFGGWAIGDDPIGRYFTVGARVRF